MRVYLHSARAESCAAYRVTVSPAGDSTFTKDIRPEWRHADGSPKQFELSFSYGAAEVDDALGKYMVARGIAHKGRLARRLQLLFTADGRPVDVSVQNGELAVRDA
jgi:hypothetical protein